MPLLPPTSDDLHFSCLDPQDIIHYSQSCKAAYQQVQSYWRRALDIYRFLSPFFSREETRQFRILQALTGTLISGSSALQFLNRTPLYPGSDLDIYVEHRYCKPIALYLQDIGYEYKPQEFQPPTLEAAIRMGSNNMDDDDVGGGQYATWNDDSAERGFAGVYNMIRGEQKIQLITAKRSPMDIILRFHSTVVMNVISYAYAYSLYPKATFQKSYGLIIDHCDGAERIFSLQKYIKRGWRMIDCEGDEWGSPEENSTQFKSTGLNVGNPLGILRTSQIRHLGDPYCWTYRLPEIADFPSGTRIRISSSRAEIIRQGSTPFTPLTLREIQSGSQSLESNSWVLKPKYDYQMDFGEMDYNVFDSPRLRYAYCLPVKWYPGHRHLVTPPGFRLPESWSDHKTPWQYYESIADTDKSDFTSHSDDLVYREFVAQHMRRLANYHNPDWPRCNEDEEGMDSEELASENLSDSDDDEDSEDSGEEEDSGNEYDHRRV
ncbi:hypothetical protein V5O48_006390 [Marasmius crinis-equi]|uniref:Uncharacterized protein n=1 Tax=Marasmius crinis-equi TaxID=585013 RepID=A0ABR3FK00_9AGAR